MAEIPLDAYDRWMIKQNVARARVEGVEIVVANLRAQGYNRVADAVEKELKVKRHFDTLEAVPQGIRAMYAANLYHFEPPPVNTDRWTELSWINYILATGGFHGTDCIIVGVGLEDMSWEATQNGAGRGVNIVRKSDGTVWHKAEPPLEWGDDWKWNIMPDGSGVYLVKTR